jgi:hypothetical protein
LSVAGVHRRAYRRAVRRTVYGAGVAAAVGYGLGGYYGGYGYPAYSYSAPYATNYGAGYGYGSYYGGYGYPGYSTAPYNPGPSFGFGWRYYPVPIAHLGCPLPGTSRAINYGLGGRCGLLPDAVVHLASGGGVLFGANMI